MVLSRKTQGTRCCHRHRGHHAFSCQHHHSEDSSPCPQPNHMVVSFCAFSLTPGPRRAHIPTLEDRTDGQLLNLIEVHTSRAGESGGVAALRSAWLRGAPLPPSGEESQERQGTRRALSIIQQTGATGPRIQDHWPQTSFERGRSWTLYPCSLSKGSYSHLLVV